MSFGFDVGNFADAARLAYLLYRDCYKVARGAPQEFQLLVSEISTLSNSLKILQEDAADPDSSIAQAGDDRVKIVNDMVGNIKVTLNKLEKIAREYEIIGSTTASKRKQMLTRFKWTFDWSTIEKLRGKLNQHNTMMSLLLTQIGNSSLQKIQSSTNALETDVHEIRKYIAAQQGDQAGNQEASKGTPIPFLSLQHDESLGKDDPPRSSLSAILLKHAEMHQPWSTIGVSQWIETGTWWLLRAQLDIRPIVVSGSTIPTPAYAKLIKASWILIDIIACHPQIAFVSSSTRAQITALSTRIKQEFEKLKISGLILPKFEDISPQDLYIWEASESKELLLRPQMASPASTLSNLWAVEGDEQALFIKIAECDLTASGPNICIVLFLAQQDGRAMRIVAKQQNGTVILNIPFIKPVTQQLESNGVVVNGQKILLDESEDIQDLFCLIEAAKLYLFQRTATHSSLQAFMIWLTLVAVQHGRKDLLSALYSSLYSSDSAPVQHDYIESQLYQVTKAFAQSLFKGDAILGPQCQFNREPIGHGRVVSLLYWAIWIGNSPLVKLLILEGVTATHSLWRHYSPLHVAALYGHDAVAHTIVANLPKDAKTLAREKDGHGRQALYYAACHGHEKVARSLLRWGAEVDDDAGGGQTALCIAAEQGHTNVVQLLLDNGASVDSSFYNRSTALHEAARQGHTNVVALLLDRGASPDAKDRFRKTPLLLACEFKRESIIALFAKKQLDFTFREAFGRTAWHLAIGPCADCDQVISQSTFDLIMQSFWATEKPQTMPLPKHRRAIVSLEMDSTRCFTLTLDSRDARFEHPKTIPSHIKYLFGRSIEFKHVDTMSSNRTSYIFHIIYACETLDFSTFGWTRLKIRGGGGFEARVFHFETHKNIATDPNAEEVQ